MTWHDDMVLGSVSVFIFCCFQNALAVAVSILLGHCDIYDRRAASQEEAEGGSLNNHPGGSNVGVFSDSVKLIFICHAAMCLGVFRTMHNHCVKKLLILMIDVPLKYYMKLGIVIWLANF